MSLMISTLPHAGGCSAYCLPRDVSRFWPLMSTRPARTPCRQPRIDGRPKPKRRRRRWQQEQGQQRQQQRRRQQQAGRVGGASGGWPSGRGFAMIFSRTAPGGGGSSRCCSWGGDAYFIISCMPMKLTPSGHVMGIPISRLLSLKSMRTNAFLSDVLR